MVGSDLLYRCRHLGPGHPEVAGLILDNPSSLTVLVEPLGTRGAPVGFLRLYGIRLTSAIAFLETAVARRGWGVEASRLLVAYARYAGPPSHRGQGVSLQYAEHQRAHPQ